MPFEEFIKHFGNWYGKGEKTATLVGIRTDESLNRFRAIAGTKSMYKDKNYSTKVNENGLETKISISKGQDIAGACGQMAGKVNQNK